MAETVPALWRPTPAVLAKSQLARIIGRLGLSGYDELYALSIADPTRFWSETLALLEIEWDTPYEQLVSFADGRESPRWFVGGRLNAASLAIRRGGDAASATRVALACEDEGGRRCDLTYGELADAVGRFAAGLRSLGVAEGDRVALMLPMTADAVVAFLAVASIGAVAVPLFSGFGPDAAVSRMELAGVRCLVTVESFVRRGRTIDLLGTVDAIRAKLGTLDATVIRRTSGDALPGWAVEWDRVAEHPPVEPIPVAADAPLLLMFTSGTTGKPKGLVHTHAGFPLKVIQDCAHVFDVQSDDRFFWPTDLGWVLGALTIYGVLGLGGTLVLYDGALDAPSWERFGSLASRHRVTHLGASPTLIRSLAANLPAAPPELPELRVLMAAGEVLDPEHFIWFHEAFGKERLPVVNYSGGTEVAGGLLANVLHRPISPSRFNSAVPGVELAVYDEAGVPIQGRPGELVILQPCVGMAAGFWEAGDKFHETYWERYPGVWAHGDLVDSESDGSFRILGRSDDTLKIAGKRTGPAEIEEIVLENDDVAEAAAIGIPDPVRGEALVVLVVPARSPAPASLADELRGSIADKLGRPFAPHRIHLVDELPRTRTGKIMRRLARNAYVGAAELGDMSALDNPSALDSLRSLRGAA